MRRSSWWQNQIQNATCYYCSEKIPPEGATMDHVVPLSQGGKSTKGNLVVSCKLCNTKKASMTAVEWLLSQNT